MQWSRVNNPPKGERWRERGKRTYRREGNTNFKSNDMISMEGVSMHKRRQILWWFTQRCGLLGGRSNHLGRPRHRDMSGRVLYFQGRKMEGAWGSVSCTSTTSLSPSPSGIQDEHYRHHMFVGWPWLGLSGFMEKRQSLLRNIPVIKQLGCNCIIAHPPMTPQGGCVTA